MAAKKRASRDSVFRSVSLAVGIITALFTIIYVYLVYYQNIPYGEYKYLGVISSLVIVLSAVGLILGVIGLLAFSDTKVKIGIALCVIVLVTLLYTDFYLIPHIEPGIPTYPPNLP